MNIQITNNKVANMQIFKGHIYCMEYYYFKCIFCWTLKCTLQDKTFSNSYNTVLFPDDVGWNPKREMLLYSLLMSLIVYDNFVLNTKRKKYTNNRKSAVWNREIIKCNWNMIQIYYFICYTSCIDYPGNGKYITWDTVSKR
jgi:hypothetical protein